jgi:YVTN family beta-propeller protein
MAANHSTGTTTDFDSFLAAFLLLEARMSLNFRWPVKASAGVIARERAVAEVGSQRRRSGRRVLRAGLCALLIAASALLAATAPAQNATVTLPVGNSPNAIVVNPVTNKIYVANAQGGGITVVDGATNVTATLTDSNANGPFAVAVNPVTNMVYVSNNGNSTISVFDGATALSPGQIAANITDGSGTGPGAIAVNPVTNLIYVCNSTAGTVVVIGGSTNTILFTIHVGNSPQAIAINTASDLIYVVNQGDNTVSVINGATNTLANLGANPNPIPVDSNPTSVGVNPATNKIYVANSVGDDISVIDGSSNTVTATLQDGLASNPYAVAVNPVTNQVFVANLFGNTTVINGFSNGITDVGTAAGSAIVVDTATNTAYVADRDANAVTAINGFSYATTVVPTQPSAEAIEIAVNPVTHKIYAANFNSAGTVTVIDGATNTVQPVTPTPPSEETAVRSEEHTSELQSPLIQC